VSTEILMVFKNEVPVYRYRGLDYGLTPGVEPALDKDGRRRYATMAWITANCNVQLVLGSEKLAEASDLTNGRCFLAD